MSSILGIIPARYASTRFPAKALVDIGGKSMIQRVYEQALKSTLLKTVLVATDHMQIFEHVQAFGGQVVMTSENHQSGTDRCKEAYDVYGNTFDYVINIQGDEPFIAPEQIDLLAGILDGQVELGTLVFPVLEESVLHNPNAAKVVLNKKQEAIYFSRSPIPFVRDAKGEWTHTTSFYRHIGIYAYRTDILSEITKLPVGDLEKAENLEQLRWIENGYSIKTAITKYDSHGIDTPGDLAYLLKKMHAN